MLTREQKEAAWKPRVVAITGPKYSGKDTAGKTLLQLNELTQLTQNRGYFFREAKMAEGVKNICKEMFGYSTELMEDPVRKEQKTDDWPWIEPRWPMMDIANWLRDKYGGDVHVRRWAMKAHEFEHKLPRANTCHVVTDLRFPEEVEFFKRKNALLLYIVRDEAEQALAEKQTSGDAMALNQSESHYDMLKRECTHLDNNGSIDQLHVLVKKAVIGHFGHWAHWGEHNEEVVEGGFGEGEL